MNLRNHIALIERIKALLAEQNGDGPKLQAIRDAIRKAEGQP